jgi:hypothetical protein
LLPNLEEAADRAHVKPFAPGTVGQVHVLNGAEKLVGTG